MRNYLFFLKSLYSEEDDTEDIDEDETDDDEEIEEEDIDDSDEDHDIMINLEKVQYIFRFFFSTRFVETCFIYYR